MYGPAFLVELWSSLPVSVMVLLDQDSSITEEAVSVATVVTSATGH